MWNLVSICLEIVLVSGEGRSTVYAKHTIGSENRFGHTKWYYKGMRLKWKLDSVYLEIVLILAQDKCTVCAERTIDSEIVLDAPNGTPW